MTSKFYETETKQTKNGNVSYDIHYVEIINNNTAMITAQSSYSLQLIKNLIDFVIRGNAISAIERSEEFNPDFSMITSDKNPKQLIIKGSPISAFSMLKDNSMSGVLFEKICMAVKDAEVKAKNATREYLNRSPSSNISTVLFHLEEYKESSEPAPTVDYSPSAKITRNKNE